MATKYTEIFKKENNFTKPENNGSIKVNWELKANNLNKIQKNNIESAYKAKTSGIISEKQYRDNLKLNGVTTIVPNSASAVKPVQSNITVPEKKKPKIPTEKLEQERLRNLTGEYNLDKVDSQKLSDSIRLKNKTPDDYYRQRFDNLKDEKKRIDEAFGPKTDFSISNFENNYDKMNKEEQEMLIHKMQLEFNRQGYKDENGLSLKTDGKYGNKTKGVYEQYKKDNNEDYTEAIATKVKFIDPEFPTPVTLERIPQTVENFKKQTSELVPYSNQTSEKQTLNQWLSSGEENKAKYEAEKMKKRLNDPKVKERADKVIKDNAEFIKKAAETFGVNPGILGACIYSEHRRNMEFNDYYLDSIAATFGKDSSLGISQVLMSTAKSMEELGYMPKIALNEQGKWGASSIGYTANSETQARIKALENPQINIMYAAAYLKYIQDLWKEAYPEIDGRTAIMATLYNIGVKEPHSAPRSNEFGDFAKDNYYYVRELMGI